MHALNSSTAPAILPDDFNHLTSVLKDHDIAAEPLSMQRERSDGVLLNWQLLTCFDSRFGPVFPFFIKWGDCEHPAKTSPRGCSLESFSVQHPLHEELSAVFDAIDLPVSAHPSQTSALDVVLSTPNGRVVL